MMSEVVSSYYDKIINTIDLLEKRDKYFELTEKIKIIKNENTHH